MLRSQKPREELRGETLFRLQQIQSAMDVHFERIRVVRVVEGPEPQPLQTLKPAVFLEWIEKATTAPALELP